MDVKQVVADYLKQEGVTTLFCYPTTPIIEACAAVGIRPVLCRQERVGVDMAHGYARVLNGQKFGVFASQYGAGVENAYSGIATAWSDAAPVLLLPLAQTRAVSQTFPMFSASRSLASVTKSMEEVVLPEETPHIMRRAFNALKNGRLGPVGVEFPLDVVNAEIDGPRFAYRPVRQTRSAGDARDIDEAARMLVEARCPIVQAGQGVLYAQASAELLELAELLQMPVMTTLDGKSAFPENHPLALGSNSLVLTGHGKHYISKSDLILALGTSLTRHALVNPILSYSKQFVHVTNDPRDLYKGYETDVAILGDAKLVLRQLIDAVADRLGKNRRDGTTRVEVGRIRDAWLDEWRPILQSNESPITPYRVIHEFMQCVRPEDAIVTHDSGSPRDQILPFYKATTPNSYIGWGKSHGLGTGLGLIMGAKIAKPEKFCVNFMGDAAFGMTGLDFETAVRCDIPILTVVFNNSTMACETEHMELSHSLYKARDIGGSYANLAKDLGGWSERVEHPAKIADAIARARQQTLEGRATLLEIMTSEEKRFSHRKPPAPKD
nr:thiamine pyrophosphate-requiring protein [Pseudomonas sp.]